MYHLIHNKYMFDYLIQSRRLDFMKIYPHDYINKFNIQ